MAVGANRNVVDVFESEDWKTCTTLFRKLRCQTMDDLPIRRAKNICHLFLRKYEPPSVLSSVGEKISSATCGRKTRILVM
jgi:hypothetical protein